MAFDYQRVGTGREPEPMGDIVRVEQHWYLTEDRTRVVAEGVEGGRWLWASPGQEVSRADAERLGALDAPDPEPTPEPVPEEDPEPEVKQRRAPANKQRAKPEDK